MGFYNGSWFVLRGYWYMAWTRWIPTIWMEWSKFNDTHYPIFLAFSFFLHIVFVRCSNESQHFFFGFVLFNTFCVVWICLLLYSRRCVISKCNVHIMIRALAWELVIPSIAPLWLFNNTIHTPQMWSVCILSSLQWLVWITRIHLCLWCRCSQVRQRASTLSLDLI